MTIETKIKFQDIVENQVPRFVRDDFPLLPDFLKSYYVSQEVPGGTLDLIQNLDRYVKVDQLYGLKTNTILSEDLTQTARVIKTQAAGNFTVGFPDKNGLIKMIAHDTNMKIPISNSIYMGEINQKFIKSQGINLDILNSMDLQKVKQKKFPVIKILKKITEKNSLFDTVLVSINDELVSLFLKNKINFLDISSKIWLLINSSIFSKFKLQKPKNLAQIEKLNEFVRLKTRTLSVISQKK